ncbi:MULTISPECIES: hypothetical protein [Streptomyces]|uniref:Integral membrane protein n=1 Tax=Streptomyces sviceus (strain ATCC 29083 / DSM 924 / JCM 4929 / NBRC 13980 / NCIMB 11184 / NRRL 5439 / UC 5370) TaxID=463191 RepID=B5HWS4_STRX2|nr:MULTISPECIES: hypothetical protein [Streptomyces]EDY57279.1 conserved hypothetical protein [Streptomyces sviceus ATCC 29083]MYT08695.1 hypothetical protein [Streptomyces sp. SID5470]
MSPLGGAALAAVVTPNPDHPSTWSGFLGFVALVIGCALALIGVYAAVSTYRGLDPARRRGQALPVTLTCFFFVAIGLAVAALGVWIL